MQLIADDAQAQRVLAFWFDGPDGSERGTVRARWFGKDPAFDEEIRDAFGALIEHALAGGCNHWAHDAASAGAGDRARPVHAQRVSRHAEDVRR